VGTSADDDYIGFVFGYQDPTHFYLFDWKKSNQATYGNGADPEPGAASAGMRVLKVAATSALTILDLWPTNGNPGRSEVLYSNAIPWANNIDYSFDLVLSSTGFSITIKQGATVLATITIADTSYATGKFGMYNFSQNACEYSGFIVTPDEPQFDEVTTNAAEILIRMALDPFIGRLSEAEIDEATINDVLGGAGEVENYFGTELCAQFSHAFDDKNMSFEEMVGQLMQAVFCTAFRRGNVLSVSFEKQRSDSMLLFNHRNKLPGSENRTITFGAVTQNDGIELSYVEPYAPNAQNVDSQYTLYFPEDQSAVAPKKINAVGVRNRVQAWMLGWRLYQKLLYQNEVTHFDATSEAALCIIGDRILVADNTRSGVQDGEVLAQNGLELTLSQPVDIGAELSPAPSYSIFLQLYDGSVESIPISAGSTDRKVILSEAPSLPLVLDEAKYARTTYMIVSEAEEDRAAFLVQEKDAKKGGIYGIKAVNYDDRYYAHDQDYNASPRIIDVIAPGEGAGAGYDKRASVGVNVDGRCRPWIAADNASFDYGIASGLPPVAVPIQSAQGDSVFINAAAPGSPSSFSMWGMPLFMTPNTVSRNDDADNAVDAEGEDDFITGQQTSEVDGYGQKRFPTYYATSPELGRSGLIGAWAIKDSPSAGKYEVVQPIAIGFGGEFIVPAGGVDTLLLGINDNKHSDNRGAFEVQVTQTGEAAGDAAAEDPVPDTTTTDPYGTTYTIQINGA